MALTIDDLIVTLGKRRIIDGLSAHIEPGRITAILGPNGAGKSTLLRAAAGLLPINGAITIDGQSVAAMPPRARARRIGYLPQQPVVHWNLTVADTVALGRMQHRHPFTASSAQDQAAIAAAMAATDLAGLADRALDTLSGGERARVLLARVMAGAPDWLLADEPLASLDPAHQVDLLARLRVLAGRGTGIVLVLHDLIHAARIADDILLLHGGKLLAQGSVAAVMTPAMLRRAYGIDFDWIGGLPMPVAQHGG